MGIYWAAADDNEKQIIHPPEGKSIKFPGLFYPTNPFSGMVMMMNCRGYNFNVINDAADEETYFNSDYKDITAEVYAEYKKLFKEYFDSKDIDEKNIIRS